MKTKLTLIAGLVIGLAAAGTTLAAPPPKTTPSTDMTAGRLGADLGRAEFDQLARKGADDRGPDDRGGRRRHSEGQVEQLARRGADDRGPDDRGGRRGGRR